MQRIYKKIGILKLECNKASISYFSGSLQLSCLSLSVDQRSSKARQRRSGGSGPMWRRPAWGQGGGPALAGVAAGAGPALTGAVAGSGECGDGSGPAR